MLDIFTYDFMIRAFLAGMVVSLIAPTIGMFLVVRRYSLLADTLSHVSLLGVALGALFGFNPILGALVISVVAALGIDRLRAKQQMFGESVLALFLSGSLALAIVLFSLSHNLNVNIFSFLFGNIATVTTTDLWLTFGMGIVVVVLVLLLYKKLFLVAHDEELALAGGMPVARLNAVMMVLSGVTVALSIRVVGVLLVGALMVVPVLTAMQLGKSFKKTSLYAVAISFAAVVSGLFTSYYLDIPSGATIVLIALSFFIASLILGGKETA